MIVRGYIVHVIRQSPTLEIIAIDHGSGRDDDDRQIAGIIWDHDEWRGQADGHRDVIVAPDRQTVIRRVIETYLDQ